MEIDNLTVFLLSTLACLLIYYRFFSRPEPLVHPLLLGKQSEVSGVRREGESGVYRSWATGQGTPLTVRPANAVKTVRDIISAPKPHSGNEPRHLLGTDLDDDALAEITRLIPLALSLMFSLSVNPNTLTPILTVLPPSPTTALPLLLLALSVPPSTPLIVLPSPAFVSTALASKGASHPRPGAIVVHTSAAEHVLEQIPRSDSTGILIVGDPQKESERFAKSARSRGVTVRYWEEMWEMEEEVKGKADLPGAHFNDVHSFFYSDGGSGNPPAVVKVTHLNFTAGIAGLLCLFPADKRPSAALKDVVASAVRLDTPLGMTIALATVWSGAGLRLIGDPTPSWDTTEHNEAEELEALMDGPSRLAPTILFLSPAHHATLLNSLQTVFLRNPMAGVAARHKVNHITSGHISRAAWPDKYILNQTRRSVLKGIAGDRLRAVITVGDTPSTSALAMSHLLLSLPFTRLHPSPFTTGPVFVSHFYDLQTPSIPNHAAPINFKPSTTGEKAHTGPPSANVEVLLKGDKVAPVEEEGEGGKQKPLEGQVWVRGPSVLDRVDQGRQVIDGWTALGEMASVQTNGTFVIHGSSK